MTRDYERAGAYYLIVAGLSLAGYQTMRAKDQP
ncbi:hypothetical protein QF031_001639 [Pseudarthrobacter defluvii]|nr:hypothetical protein [Pseudarthrobacter defluvii]